MPKRADIFLIHGIEERLDDSVYYVDFINAVRKYLPPGAQVEFHATNWSQDLEDKENKLYEWLQGWKDKSGEGLNYMKLRYVACTLICDVLAYAPPERIPAPGDVYYDVNKTLTDKLDIVSELYPDSIKVIIGHSMGSQIGLSLCWRRKVDALITMGSPIPYFSVRFKDFGQYPPNVARFVNFYNDHDVVSCPISVNPAFSQVEDVPTASWNPLDALPLRAHTRYWSDDFVHQKIAQVITNLISTAPG